jgi:hypothetical protein
VSDEQLKPDDLTVEADRVFDACLRAANVLEYCREVPSLSLAPAVRVLDAATTEVQDLRRLRDERCRHPPSEGSFEAAQRYLNGRWTPHTLPLDTALQMPSGSLTVQGVIDRLLMLADCVKHIVWLSGDRGLRRVAGWREQPDWDDLERQTARLIKAARRLLKTLRQERTSRSVHTVATCAEEIAFRSTRLEFRLVDGRVIDTLAGIGLLQGSSWHNLQGTSHCQIAWEIGRKLEPRFDGCIRWGLESSAPWMTAEDRYDLAYEDEDDGTVFWGMDADLVKEHWADLTTRASTVPPDHEFEILQREVEKEFAAARRVAREQLIAAGGGRVPEPEELGFRPVSSDGPLDQSSRVFRWGGILIDGFTLLPWAALLILWKHRHERWPRSEFEKATHRKPFEWDIGNEWKNFGPHQTVIRNKFKAAGFKPPFELEGNVIVWREPSPLEGQIFE